MMQPDSSTQEKKTETAPAKGQWKADTEWLADSRAAAFIRGGWDGVGYTVWNRNNARRQAVFATDSAERQNALDDWVRDRAAEGYIPLFRYYIGKSPCRMADSEFGGPVVLRRSAAGYDVIAELMAGFVLKPGDAPKNFRDLLGDDFDAMCRDLRLEEVCDAFALIASMKAAGAEVSIQNMRGIGPDDRGSNLEPETVTFHAMPKIGRNDPCPCASGKKYKKCCGRVN